MEKLPSNLIKKGFKLEDPTDQTKCITEALKLITDNMPYTEVYDLLAEDTYLVKYLVLSLPFHHHNVESTINLLMYMLQDKPSFFRNFFLSITEVVMLQSKESVQVGAQNAKTKIQMQKLIDPKNSGKKMSDEITDKMDNEDYDARTLIDQYPIIVKKNIENIKKMTLIFVQKAMDIVKLKFPKYSMANKTMISDCLFSYFKHLIVFSTDQELIKFVLYSVRKITINAPDILKSSDADRIQGIANLKNLEQQNLEEKRKMKSHLKIRKFNLQDKKEGILGFKQSIQKLGLLKTIKNKVNNFLKLVQEKNNTTGIENKEREIGDFKDFLEEFLISGDFNINSNEFLIFYLKQDDRNLDILMNFITNPFSYSLSDFFIEFHKQFKIKFKNLKFNKPKSYEQFRMPHDADTEKLRKIMTMAFSSDLTSPFGGPPQSGTDIHNKEVYYLRAFYATVFLTIPGNHIFLSKHNSSFLTALFDQIYFALRPTVQRVFSPENNDEDTLQQQLSLHYPFVLHLYKFYLAVLPSLFTYHILNKNLFHQMLYNIDDPSVQPFIVHFLSPFDCMYRMPKPVKYLLYRWSKESGIFKDISEICLKGHKAAIEDGKFDKDWKNSEMSHVVKKLESCINMVDQNDTQMAVGGGSALKINQNFEMDTGRMWKIWQKDWFFTEIEQERRISEIVEERFNMNGLDIDRIFEIDVQKNENSNRSSTGLQIGKLDPKKSKFSVQNFSAEPKYSNNTYYQPLSNQEMTFTKEQNSKTQADGDLEKTAQFGQFNINLNPNMKNNISKLSKQPSFALNMIELKYNKARDLYKNSQTFEEKKILLLKKNNTLKWHKDTIEHDTSKLHLNESIVLPLIAKSQLGSMTDRAPIKPLKTSPYLDLGSTNLNKTYDTGSYPKKDVETMEKRFAFVEAPARIEYFTEIKQPRKTNLGKTLAFKSHTVDNKLRPHFWFKQLMLNQDLIKEIKKLEGNVKEKEQDSELFLNLKKIEDTKQENVKSRHSMMIRNNQSSFQPLFNHSPKHSPTKSGNLNKSPTRHSVYAGVKPNIVLKPLDLPSNKQEGKLLTQKNSRIITSSKDVVDAGQEYKNFAYEYKKSLSIKASEPTSEIQEKSSNSNHKSNPSKKLAKIASFENIPSGNLLLPLSATKSKLVKSNSIQTKQPPAIVILPEPVSIARTISGALKLKIEKVIMPLENKETKVDDDFVLSQARLALFKALDKQSTFVPVAITDTNPKNQNVGTERQATKGELLYPGKPIRLDIPKDVETLIMSEDFTYLSINKMEYLSLPAAKTLYHIVNDATDYIEDSLTTKMGFEQHDIISFWSCLLGSQSASPTFENIYLTFLLKFEHSCIIQTEEATGFITAKTINLILSKMNDSPMLQKFKRESNFLFDRYHMYFDELVHNVFQLYENTEDKDKYVRFQNTRPVKQINEYRLVLIEHFFLIIMNHNEPHKNSLIGHLNLRLLHIVIRWVLEHFGNNVIMNKFLRFLEHCSKHHFEQIFLDIFIKLNFVSSLYNILDEICKNDVVLDQFRAEDQFIMIQDVVKVLGEIEKKVDFFPKFVPILQKIHCWNKLKSVLKGNEKHRKNSLDKMKQIRVLYEERQNQKKRKLDLDSGSAIFDVSIKSQGKQSTKKGLRVISSGKNSESQDVVSGLAKKDAVRLPFDFRRGQSVLNFDQMMSGGTSELPDVQKARNLRKVGSQNELDHHPGQNIFTGSQTTKNIDRKGNQGQGFSSYFAGSPEPSKLRLFVPI